MYNGVSKSRDFAPVYGWLYPEKSFPVIILYYLPGQGPVVAVKTRKYTASAMSRLNLEARAAIRSTAVMAHFNLSFVRSRFLSIP